MKDIEIITEDDIVQEDLDNRSDTYRDIYDQLVKYTNNFTKESGSFPLQTATEYNNAVKILKDHYNIAEKDGLDYERSEVEGTDYRVKFSEPKDLDESYKESKVLDMFVEDVNDDFDIRWDNQFSKYIDKKLSASEFSKFMQEVEAFE